MSMTRTVLAFVCPLMSAIKNVNKTESFTPWGVFALLSLECAGDRGNYFFW